MNGHHLILGTVTDYLTGEFLQMIDDYVASTYPSRLKDQEST